MKKYLLIFTLILILNPLFGQTIEQELVKKVIHFSGNDDFKTLGKILKDKRLIILGEASHYDGTTFETRIKFIKYLQKELNFDVLGLEAFDSIESMTLQDNCEKITSTKFDINKYWIPLWTNTVECQPLISMIKNKEITIFGFDCHPRFYTIDCIKNLFMNLDSRNTNLVNWDKMNTIYRKIFHRYYFKDLNVPTNDEHLYFLNTINTLKNYSTKLSRTQNTKALELLKQSIQNLKSIYDLEFIVKTNKNFYEDYEAIINSNNIRDKQMAENIIHYMKLNPGKKIIIWCANFHGARDISQTIYKNEITMYARTKLMGEYLSEELGDQLYSIAFTSPSEHQDDIENYLAKKNINFGFIDFSPLRYDNQFFDKAFKSNVIGYKSGKWMSIFDGIYFIKNQRRSTTINK